ncbi:MAG: heavy metal translocating P-type ATPase [Clostridia bacterium]|nr:heavy metal translocating P-type ATPase [Clostridia bacterium]
MQNYNVTGMSCAACSARVEKAVKAVEGVSSCAVSLLTNSMGVEGTASPQAIIKAVENAGYGASLKGAEKKTYVDYEDTLRDTETPKLKKRLISSVFFLLVLMYFSMGHMMWGFPLPAFFNDNHVAMGLVQLLLSAIVMIINGKFFISGFKGLIHRAPNMDTLVALGSSASFVWSVYALFMMTDAQLKGGASGAMPWMDEFYFESAAMILTLITVGKMLEARSKGKTTNALKSLMRLTPKTANIVRDGEEVTVNVEEVNSGDVFVVRPGEAVPVDGIVLEGHTAVNESALTGESIPVDKAEGDTVSAATINQSGFIKAQATRVGEDTTLSQIIKMVSDAATTKAPIAKIADKVSGVFVPAVISIAVITLIVWLIIGKPIDFALARAISVLVISCPCALGLATPVAIMVGNGVGAKNGILFKTAVSLEETGKVNIVALDKTGTITKGEPQVTDIIPAEGISEGELILKAVSLESKSEHPLAKAVMLKAEEHGITPRETENFTALPGNGLKAKLRESELIGGSMKYISSVIGMSSEYKTLTDRLSSEGKTPLVFAENNRLIGIIAVADVIKEDSPKAIEELQNMGIKVVMLTGDNERTAKAIGDEAGVDSVIAGVLPDGKEEVIRKLREHGRVAMVGDGINDAPALTRADIGIAIGAGADVAVDAADVVVMKSRLSDVVAAIRLSRAALRNIHENLFWAFFYNAIGIPLAAGCYIALFGWSLNPMFGAAAMSLSSFCVVTNALRLNLVDVYSSKRDKKQKHIADITDVIPASESKTTELTIAIEGMMCHHCEATVKNALEAVSGVKTAEPDFEKGTCRVLLTAEIDREILRKAIEDKDYKVLSFSDDENENKIIKENITMTKTMNIQGMMCPHCEANVKKTLEAIEGVESAVVSHEAGTAVVTLTAEVADEVLKSAVEAKDYKVTSIA